MLRLKCKFNGLFMWPLSLDRMLDHCSRLKSFPKRIHLPKSCSALQLHSRRRRSAHGKCHLFILVAVDSRISGLFNDLIKY